MRVKTIARLVSALFLATLSWNPVIGQQWNEDFADSNVTSDDSDTTRHRSHHVLTSYANAARAKWLPAKILDELIQANANIAIRSTSGGPSYQPGTFGGGTIYLPFASTPPTQWKNQEWSNFYNEAFSAWWGNVFLKNARYSTHRSVLLNNARLTAKYRRAHPRNPSLAQEEGYSETTASILTIGYPRPVQNPQTGQFEMQPTPYEKLFYRIGLTVAPVSHSDRPGYTPEAEDTYPDESEYDYIMQWLFGRNAPPKPE